jgi:pyruvate dehydrogenase E1 component alpha subunit
MGGHMQLFSKEYLAASSGIVGAAGPTAAGFALAAQHLRPGTVAVALFGEGAMNQGMLMEAMNLASVWKLPVLYVCKDDSWSITTESGKMTGGNLNERARGLGVSAIEVDGRDVSAVWEASRSAIERARSGQGPSFLHARCVHLEAHLLGFQLLRMVREPFKEMPGLAGPLTRSLFRLSGAALGERTAGLKVVLASVLSTLRDPRRDSANDPVQHTRETLLIEPMRLRELEDQIEHEVSHGLASALAEVSS